MINVKDAADFSRIVKAFKAENKGVLTNCFMMPNEIEKLCQRDMLKVILAEDWLFFLVDYEDYTRVCYYTTAESGCDNVNLLLNEAGNRRLFLDIVTKNSRGDFLTCEKLLSKEKAEKYKSYQRMELKPESFDFEKFPVSCKGYRIVNDYKNYEKVISLWKETLDEKSTPLPSLSCFIKEVEKGHILCAVDDKGELCAVVALTVNGRNALLEHLAVSPLHRRKGLAMSLVANLFMLAKEREIVKVRLWVDQINKSACTLYERIGFIEDGMICNQLKMKGQ